MEAREDTLVKGMERDRVKKGRGEGERRKEGGKERWAELM